MSEEELRAAKPRRSGEPVPVALHTDGSKRVGASCCQPTGCPKNTRGQHQTPCTQAASLVMNWPAGHWIETEKVLPAAVPTGIFVAVCF